MRLLSETGIAYSEDENFNLCCPSQQKMLGPNLLWIMSLQWIAYCFNRNYDRDMSKTWVKVVFIEWCSTSISSTGLSERPSDWMAMGWAYSLTGSYMFYMANTPLPAHLMLINHSMLNKYFLVDKLNAKWQLLGVIFS